jgi:hypothetical protein
LLQVSTNEDLLDLINDLKRVRSSSLPRSTFIISLAAEAQVSKAILSRTQRQHGFLHSAIETTQLALRLCSEAAEVLRCGLLLRLSNLHFKAPHYPAAANTEMDIHAHLDASVQMASEARSLTTLMERNAYERCQSLYQWGKCVMHCAVKSEDLDAMELSIDALREALLICPDLELKRKFHAEMLNTLTYAVGLYFDRTVSWTEVSRTRSQELT